MPQFWAVSLFSPYSSILCLVCVCVCVFFPFYASSTPIPSYAVHLPCPDSFLSLSMTAVCERARETVCYVVPPGPNQNRVNKGGGFVSRVKIKCNLKSRTMGTRLDTTARRSSSWKGSPPNPFGCVGSRQNQLVCTGRDKKGKGCVVWPFQQSSVESCSEQEEDTQSRSVTKRPKMRWDVEKLPLFAQSTHTHIYTGTSYDELFFSG